ncbi:hypothetical protein [Virgisporangium aurantiacum]|uniref:Carboxypeptidase regulatory-like domain-containing protein n=1 Tax=Virgisporangium aurantiacum TaxID=175570 RepID=A0A8J3Z0B2_9ACTN|nr:hypothetical protein [Virgisporangium aurantiacum]GIJ55294.1 hypothetical protein Vau01_028100 [Virgisporangium aurantiacum]
MAGIRWEDDNDLLALLEEALDAEGDVPPDFIAAGKAAFAWRTIDAELAALVYDSDREPALTRTQTTADLRALTFASAHVTIELELTGVGLIGQLVPPSTAEIDVQTAAGVTSSVTTDELGCFTIRVIPQEPFRLRCRAGETIDVLTTWITR